MSYNFINKKESKCKRKETHITVWNRVSEFK